MPAASDRGLSVGAAMLFVNELKKEIKKVKTIFTLYQI